MISSIVALTAVLPSVLSSAETERVYAQLCQTPTVQSSRQEHPLVIKPSAREEVALYHPTGVTVSEGFLRNHSEAEVAWALAYHLGSRVRFVTGGDSNVRTGLRIYKEAGYDPFLPAASIDRQTDYLRRVSPDWQLGALALELAYGPAGYTPFRSPVYRSAPTTGEVEHTWRYDDPAWTEWFAQETGRPRPVGQDRFAAGQCTALAYAIRPDFPFDRRGGGRNDARNWLALAKAAGWSISPLPSYLSIGVQDAWAGNPAGHVFVCLGQTPDGKIRAIDSNFGKQPDNLVRVRVFDPDTKILGYITPPSDWQLSRPVTPEGATLTRDKPYWHGRIDGRALAAPHTDYALEFRLRSKSAGSSEVKLWAITSTSQTETMTVRPNTEWQTVRLGSFIYAGGGDVIPPHAIHSIALFVRSAMTSNEQLEISEAALVQR